VVRLLGLGILLVTPLASGCCCPVVPFAVGVAVSASLPAVPPRNGITRKVDATEARAQATDYDFAAGDSVRVLRHFCYRGRRAGDRECVDDPVGIGTVVAEVSPHVLDLRFAPGVDFREGDFIAPAGR
jgi:hypothetical protein